jgi:hypothetical protein
MVDWFWINVQSMMGFIGCVLWAILLHALSFGIGITGGGGCFGHIEVLVEVGFILSFGNVAWDFDVFVHFDWKSFVWLFFVCHWNYYYIGGSFILKCHHNILPFEGLQS